MKSLIAFTIVVLAGCSTIDSVYTGAQGIVGGVKADVVGVTTGTLEAVSGAIKDTAERTEPVSK